MFDARGTLRDPGRGEPAAERGRFDRVHELHLGRVRRDVEARPEPDLHDRAAQTRAGAVAEPLHVGATAHLVDDPREDLLAVDTHHPSRSSLVSTA